MILDDKGRDTEHEELKRMLKHWLSSLTVCRKLQRIGQYPSDQILKEIFKGTLDKAATAHWVRKLLLSKKVRSIIKQILIANHGVDGKKIEKALLVKAASLVTMAKFHKADLVLPGTPLLPQVGGPIPGALLTGRRR